MAGLCCVKGVKEMTEIIKYGENYTVCYNKISGYWSSISGARLTDEMQSEINKVIDKDWNRRKWE